MLALGRLIGGLAQLAVTAREVGHGRRYDAVVVELGLRQPVDVVVLARLGRIVDHLHVVGPKRRQSAVLEGVDEGDGAAAEGGHVAGRLARRAEEDVGVEEDAAEVGVGATLGEGRLAKDHPAEDGRLTELEEEGLAKGQLLHAEVTGDATEVRVGIDAAHAGQVARMVWWSDAGGGVDGGGGGGGGGRGRAPRGGRGRR